MAKGLIERKRAPTREEIAAYYRAEPPPWFEELWGG
jgi:hypothetical protein